MPDKIVYDGWLKLYKRQLQNREYDILKDNNAVAAIIVNEQDEILLVKQFRPALMEETLEIPAGNMDIDGENELECLIRELNEETGLKLRSDCLKQVLSYKPNMGFSSSGMKVFASRIIAGELKINEGLNDEDVYEVLWMGLDALGRKIAKGEILDVKTILAYYFIKAGDFFK